MNVKHLTALLLLSASAGAVLADTDTTSYQQSAGFARTRAEVVADVAQEHSQHWQANGDAEYPNLPAAESGMSTQQAQANLTADHGASVADTSGS